MLMDVSVVVITLLISQTQHSTQVVHYTSPRNPCTYLPPICEHNNMDSFGTLLEGY